MGQPGHPICFAGGLRIPPGPLGWCLPLKAFFFGGGEGLSTFLELFLFEHLQSMWFFPPSPLRGSAALPLGPWRPSPMKSTESPQQKKQRDVFSWCLGYLLHRSMDPPGDVQLLVLLLFAGMMKLVTIWISTDIVPV